MSKPKVVTISSTLTEAERKVFKAAYDYCDGGNGMISLRELGTGMRLLRRNPSQAEVVQIAKELDEKNEGFLDFDQFVTSVYRPPQVPLICEEDVREAFRCLDNTADSLIPVELITKYLTGLAERLDDDEMVELLRYSDPEKTDFMNYEKFITEIFHPLKPEKKKKGKKGKKK